MGFVRRLIGGIELPFVCTLRAILVRMLSNPVNELLNVQLMQKYPIISYAGGFIPKNYCSWNINNGRLVQNVI